MKIQEYISLAPLTIFKIGGTARYFCKVVNHDELKEAVAFAKAKSIPFVVLGAGSNVLIADAGYQGLVIKMNMRNLSVEGTHISADAGASMAHVVAASINAGLSGFEWGVGVPGTIGGSVRGNAGCYGSEMKDATESILVFNSSTGALQTFTNADAKFNYRESIFKLRPELIIVSAVLLLHTGNTQESRAKIAHYSRARISDAVQASGRTGSQEIGKNTAGSTFKNVVLSPEQKVQLLKQFPQLADVFVSSPDSLVLPAGFLIDIAGLKGTRIGGSVISHKHANFIINDGSARAQDVIDIIHLVKEKIYKKFTILLEEEIQCIGFE
jgi:UDP-N-acetylmuramate dehydrogenase